MLISKRFAFQSTEGIVWQFCACDKCERVLLVQESEFSSSDENISNLAHEIEYDCDAFCTAHELPGYVRVSLDFFRSYQNVFRHTCGYNTIPGSYIGAIVVRDEERARRAALRLLVETNNSQESISYVQSVMHLNVSDIDGVVQVE